MIDLGNDILYKEGVNMLWIMLLYISHDPECYDYCKYYIDGGSAIKPFSPNQEFLTWILEPFNYKSCQYIFN